jgi:LytTr DNA-binding domain
MLASAAMSRCRRFCNTRWYESTQREAAGDYAELHVRGRSHLLCETMNSRVQKLDPTEFLRIHRSRIVPTRCIVELHAIENREYLVKLSDGSQQRSSRTYADNLQVADTREMSTKRNAAAGQMIGSY